MVHRHLPQFETVTRCGRSIPCQVCEERDRGCTLKCAHDYSEAAEALSRQAQLPDLVVLDLHFALPEERLLPEDKAQHQGRRALEELRRKQGLHILEGPRRSDGGAAPTDRGAVALAASGVDRRRDGDWKELPRGARAAPAVGRQGSAGGD